MSGGGEREAGASAGEMRAGFLLLSGNARELLPQVRQSLSEHGPLGWGGVSRWSVRAEWHSSAWGGNSIIGMLWGSMRYLLEFVDREGKGALMAPQCIFL